MVTPNPALRWLRRVRWALLLSELVFVALSLAGLLDPLPLAPIGGLGAVLVAADLAQAAVLERRPALRDAAVGAHVAFDLVWLACLVSLSPDAHQPLQAFFVVEPAVAATVLGLRAAAASAGAATALQAAAVLGTAIARRDEELPHLASHTVLLGVATLTTTGFVAQLASALRDRTAALARAEQARLAAERLAALGTLAAGVAHELATPLGAVGLLVEELAIPDLPEADRAVARRGLDEALARCKDLLQRLKTGPGELAGRTDELPRRVEAWIRDWHAVNGGAARPTLEVRGEVRAVRGAEERWRGAFWTVLDNAHRAGGPIRVTVGASAAGPGHVELVVEDQGCGVDLQVAERAGEPFFSGWRTGAAGQGLGLYAARSFARAVGGDLSLEPGRPAGARATLRMPLDG